MRKSSEFVDISNECFCISLNHLAGAIAGKSVGPTCPPIVQENQENTEEGKSCFKSNHGPRIMRLLVWSNIVASQMVTLQLNKSADYQHREIINSIFTL